MDWKFSESDWTNESTKFDCDSELAVLRLVESTEIKVWNIHTKKSRSNDTTPLDLIIDLKNSDGLLYFLTWDEIFIYSAGDIQNVKLITKIKNIALHEGGCISVYRGSVVLGDLYSFHPE